MRPANAEPPRERTAAISAFDLPLLDEGEDLPLAPREQVRIEGGNRFFHQEQHSVVAVHASDDEATVFTVNRQRFPSWMQRVAVQAAAIVQEPVLDCLWQSRSVCIVAVVAQQATRGHACKLDPGSRVEHDKFSRRLGAGGERRRQPPRLRALVGTDEVRPQEIQ